MRGHSLVLGGDSRVVGLVRGGPLLAATLNPYPSGSVVFDPPWHPPRSYNSSPRVVRLSRWVVLFAAPHSEAQNASLSPGCEHGQSSGKLEHSRRPEPWRWGVPSSNMIPGYSRYISMVIIGYPRLPRLPPSLQRSQWPWLDDMVGQLPPTTDTR